MHVTSADQDTADLHRKELGMYLFGSARLGYLTAKHLRTVLDRAMEQGMCVNKSEGWLGGLLLQVNPSTCVSTWRMV